MIEARSLTARFGTKTAVDAISFTLKPTSVVGFLGPNGAGKSTTMRILSGYLLPASGSAEIAGHDIVTARRTAQSLIGYLPEAPHGFDHLNVGEFLNFCARARGLRGPLLKKRFAIVCEQLELAVAIDTPMIELSKGWRQRAWFAQALIHDPPVLILDEPTDGLDPNQKKRVRKLIRALAPLKTILLSTHILEEAEELCSRAIILANGKIVADKPTSELQDDAGRLSESFHVFTDYNDDDVQAPRV